MTQPAQPWVGTRGSSHSSHGHRCKVLVTELGGCASVHQWGTREVNMPTYSKARTDAAPHVSQVYTATRLDQRRVSSRKKNQEEICSRTPFE